jgi:hypothetical protein
MNLVTDRDLFVEATADIGPWVREKLEREYDRCVNSKDFELLRDELLMDYWRIYLHQIRPQVALFFSGLFLESLKTEFKKEGFPLTFNTILASCYQVCSRPEQLLQSFKVDLKHLTHSSTDLEAASFLKDCLRHPLLACRIPQITKFICGTDRYPLHKTITVKGLQRERIHVQCCFAMIDIPLSKYRPLQEGKERFLKDLIACLDCFEKYKHMYSDGVDPRYNENVIVIDE